MKTVVIGKYKISVPNDIAKDVEALLRFVVYDEEDADTETLLRVLHYLKKYKYMEKDVVEIVKRAETKLLTLLRSNES